MSVDGTASASHSSGVFTSISGLSKSSRATVVEFFTEYFAPTFAPTNFASGQCVWDDPRPAFDLSRTEHRVAVASIVGFFVVAFALAVLLRLRYLRAHYPELLNPTMKRKARKAKWKRRPAYQNSKNRMSQDGKGGRSANS